MSVRPPPKHEQKYEKFYYKRLKRVTFLFFAKLKILYKYSKKNERFYFFAK